MAKMNRSAAAAIGAAFSAAAFLLVCGGCGGPQAPAPRDDNAGYHQLREVFGSRDFTPLAGRRILIDPGHGGHFRGVTGRDGLDEAEVNLGVSLWLRGLLEWAGAEAFLTRTADVDFLTPADSSLAADLAVRIAICDSLSPDVFISIHHNSNPALDRLINETQTYYPVGRDGPDLDLARSVHRHLVKNLEISPARIMPGNFYVLRNCPVPAVLGEPSMLSNPHVERKLSLARKQELEAQAYFLGLLDFFTGGDPRFAGPFAAGSGLADGAADTLDLEDAAGREASARWLYLSDREGAPAGPPLDPASVRLLVDGREAPAAVSPGGGEVAADFPVPDGPGPHALRLLGRNTAGRSVRPWIREWTNPPAEPSRDLTALAEALLPHGLAPVAIGTWPDGPAVPGGRWIRRLPGPRIPPLPADIPAPGPADPVVLVRPGAPLWLEAPGALPLLNEAFDPQSAPAPAWRPLLPGVAGKTVVIDPKGGAADDDGRGPLGATGSEINLRVAEYLADLLAGAGARPLLIRKNEDWTPPQHRVLLANRSRADLYLVIRRAEADAAGTTARHHHGSAAGSNWAELAAAALAAASDDTAAALVEPSWAYLLRHTACPALELSLPAPADIESEAALTDPAAQQAAARAIFNATVSQLAERSVLFPTMDIGAMLAGHPELAPAAAETDWARLDGNLLWLPGAPSPGLAADGDRHTLEVSAGGRWALSILEADSAGGWRIRRIFGSEDR